MCGLAALGAISGIASAGFSAYSAIQQGDQAQASAEYNARVQENEATAIRNQGIEAENDQRRKTAQAQSRQRAALAASGVDITSGSAANILEDTETIGEIDALRIRSNAQERADAADQGAVLTRFGGEAAKSQSIGQATGSLLSAGSSLSSKLYTKKSAGSNIPIIDRSTQYKPR